MIFVSEIGNESGMAVNRGIVYLVGAGPGDPGLLTRRGESLLKLAEVVVYDHLASSRLLDLAPKTARRICAGKSIGHNTMSQGAINELLVEQAKAGHTVVRLKGGDPYVFGRGAEEAEYLAAAGVPFQVVPGVTAAVGVTAYAGVPVTHRDTASAVAFITGHNDPEASPEHGRLDWAALARFPGTLVFYMGVTRLESICKTLMRLGKPETTPAALVEAGTLPRQRTVSGTLADLHRRVAEEGLGPPALLVVGEVVSHRPALRWFENLPLAGQRIVVTRPAGEAEASATTLESLGAEVLIAPTVEIQPLESYDELDRILDRLAEFHWLVFTSANGVDGFLERLEAVGRDVRALGHLKLAAIGSATAGALGKFHLKADLIPRSFRSEDLAEALGPAVKGQRVLLARADRGRTLLKDELEKIADVEQVTVYRNVDADALPAAVAARLEKGSIDWITITSSAIAERLASLLSETARARVGREIRLASLSPLTSETARSLGWNVAAEAKDSTREGLVEAIVEVVAADRAKKSRAAGP